MLTWMYNHNNQLHFILCILGEGSFLNILNCSFAFLWLSHKIHLYSGFSHSRSIANCTFSTFFLMYLLKQLTGRIREKYRSFSIYLPIYSWSIVYLLLILSVSYLIIFKENTNFKFFSLLKFLVQEN